MRNVVIVGASVAGVTAADALRLEGYGGAITLLGEERHPPYTRPPLSKAVLRGSAPPESVMLPSLGADIDVRLGCRATGLDMRERAVIVAGGERVPFDALVIATGARARRLAAPGQLGERVLRTLGDAMALRGALEHGPSVLIVGGGFLGMEIASTCRELGLRVDLVDREPPLIGVLGPSLASPLIAAARDHGVGIHVSPGGSALVGRADAIDAVALADGRVLHADIVVSAVGDEPNVDWLEGSGLLSDGVLVADHRCRVAPGIVAVGDVAATRRAGDHAPRRTPYWTAAVEQARTAAATLVHDDVRMPPPTVPYFWTEQFGLAVKICGRLPVVGEPAVVDGCMPGPAVLQWHAADAPVTAASVNHRMPVGRLKRLAAAAVDRVQRD